MFYSQFILAKKGPLGTIWIAAHLERKLRKNQVADTDIGVSVDSILFPEVPIALRLSSHLLLGVVRIYSRKVNYLFDDCSEALLKIKQAFRSSAVDLPPEESTAPYHSITLPETFDLDDFELPDNDIFQGNYVDHHVSTREQITLQDTMDGVVYSASQFGLDERFGDGDASQVRLDLEEDLFLDKVAATKHDEISKNEALASTELMEYAKTVASHERMTEFSGYMQLNGTRNKIEDLDASLEVVGNAQSPSTPESVEGPNVSSVKDVVWNDCLEAEDQNIRALGGMEISENAPSKLSLHHVNDAMDFSMGGHSNHDTSVCRPSEEYRHLSADLEMTEGHSAAMATEHSPANESVSTMDGSHKIQDKSKDILCNNEQNVDQIKEDCGEFLEETDGVEFASKIEESLSDGNAVVQIPVHSSELPTVSGSVSVVIHDCQKDPESLNGHVTNEQIKGSLQPCNLHPSQPEILSDEANNSLLPADLQSVDVASLSLETIQKEEGFDASRTSTKVQGEECQVTDDVQSNENLILELPINVENQADGGKHDLLYSEIFNDNKYGSLNSSITSEFPAPEKLLSPPHGICDKPHDLFVEFSDKEAQEEGDGSGAGTNISGKKRSFTESSLTVESLNSVESFGVTRSKRTVDLVPDDDDLLSSILVGRKSSFLKMKPTPAAPEVPSMKRARSISRPSVLKRKVLTDDLMVLHGDTIREQLTDTEDIRRLRKKAPCTLTEMVMIQRQHLEEEIFREPVLTGMSPNLTRLHGEAFDLSGIKVCEKYDDGSATQGVTQDGKTEASIELVGCRNEINKQTSEVFTQEDNHQVEDHSGFDNIDCQGHINNSTVKVNSRTSECELSGEMSEMQVHKVNVEAAVVAKHLVLGIETSQSGPACGDIIEVPSGIVDQLAVMDRTIGTGELMQVDTPRLPSDKTDDQLIEHVPCLRDTSNGVSISPAENNVAVETEQGSGKEICDESNVSTLVEIRGDKQPDGSAPTDDVDAFLSNASSEAGGCIKFRSTSIDQALEESENNKHGVHSDDGVPGERSMDVDDKDQMSNFCSEEAVINSTYIIGLDEDKTTMMNDQNNTVCELDDEHNTTDAQNAPLNHVTTGEYDDIRLVGSANDTEFLNVDDDEIDEDDDTGLANAEDSHLLENSGWSSRTRAVAKYLQNIFDKEAEQGRKVMLMNNLLIGKTRKEASRMFFETLVLKTKDYVHVEQAKPFDNINIKPRAKLMKSNF